MTWVEGWRGRQLTDRLSERRCRRRRRAACRTLSKTKRRRTGISGDQAQDLIDRLGRAASKRGTSRASGNPEMIRKLKGGKYRLYSRKKDEKTGKRWNLVTFDTREAAEKHELEVQYFKRH
jgi:hypothetical protein